MKKKNCIFKLMFGILALAIIFLIEPKKVNAAQPGDLFYFKLEGDKDVNVLLSKTTP